LSGALATTVHGQANSWDSGAGGRWESGAHWSLTVPPTNSQSGIFITNGFGLMVFSKIVTADATSASSPGTMTISNLTLSAVTHQNILLVTNTGAVALHVINSLTISNGGVLRVFSSPLQVTGHFVVPLFLGNLLDDGSLTLNGSGALGVITVGSIPFIVGHNGTGAYLQNSGTLSAVSLVVGDNSGAQGTVTLAGGLTTLSSDLTLGYAAGSIGNIAISGGNLVATNGEMIVGNAGRGNFNISTGMSTLGSNVTVGNLAGSDGTLLVEGGTLTIGEGVAGFNLIYPNLIIGNSAGATGAVWVTGGQLTMNPCFANGISSVYLGLNGVGQCTLSNGIVSLCEVYVGENPGSQGTLTVAGGVAWASSLLVGTGSVLVTGGQLNVAHLDFGSGQLTISDGTVNASTYIRLSDKSAAWVNGGELLAAGDSEDVALEVGGTMSVSNGTVQLFSLDVTGTFSLAGGVVLLYTTLSGGSYFNANGSVWITGGQLITTNVDITVASNVNTAQITVSNGLVNARSIAVGSSSLGALTVAGGTTVLSSNLTSGDLGATGLVWVTGGQLVVTNAPTIIGNSPSYFGNTSYGQMTLSNGTFLARDVIIGNSNTAQGALIVPSGNWTVLSNIIVGASGAGQVQITGGQLTALSGVTVGNCAGSGVGTVTIAGGSLYVTNSTGTAVLDVRHGQLILNSGLLQVDKLVMTNSCGLIIHNGGTLLYNSLVLDPTLDADGDGLPNGWEQGHNLDPLNPNGNDGASGDPDGDGMSNLQEYLAGTDPHNRASVLRMISVVRQDPDIHLTWTSAGGKTNAVQAASGSGGSYATNFTDLASFVMGGSGDVTNTYIDPGGATNKPARYYRVRLVP
jgi:hypothetical protein